MSLYGRFFARHYDGMLQNSEDAGLREKRRALVAQARGRVLEIGAGTGLNFSHYPSEGIDELVLSEPEEPMARRLKERVRQSAPAACVVRAPAENLPFEDGSFDTVVSTLVLCTVGDQESALREVRRVLADGGRLLFLEHVRSDDAAQARWQDRLHRPWRALGHGCNCNLTTVTAIDAAGFRLEGIEHGTMPSAPKIVRPLVTGVAVAT